MQVARRMYRSLTNGIALVASVTPQVCEGQGNAAAINEGVRWPECSFPMHPSRDRVSECITSALFMLQDHQRETWPGGPSIGEFVGGTNETSLICPSSGSKTDTWGCVTLTDLAWEFLAKGMVLLAACRLPDEIGLGDCNRVAQKTLDFTVEKLDRTESRFRNSPLSDYVSGKLKPLRDDFLKSLNEGGTASTLWTQIVWLTNSIVTYVRWSVWRLNHFLWLMDSMQQGSVAHSSWGSQDAWDGIGAHDAHTESPLAQPHPSYQFSDEYGMRWDIVISLLTKLYASRGSQGQLTVVEIGVFAAHFSKFIMEALPFVQLVGIDPYIGSDGTFPGEFSKTLDPDIALAQATETFESFGPRAALLSTTGEEAAKAIPTESVDAVFIDGCHLYECVQTDLATWRPKLRRDAPTLVCGHDFSPQWPGVVRAVHEQRVGGQEVQLGMDWMWWWFEGGTDGVSQSL